MKCYSFALTQHIPAISHSVTTVIQYHQIYETASSKP